MLHSIFYILTNKVFFLDKNDKIDYTVNNSVWKVLRWREKTIRAATSAGCAEMRKTYKIGYFIHFGEIGD